MDINPIKALVDLVDRGITERGSAQILRERLGLAADKYDALATKAEQLEAENTSLKAELKREKEAADRLRAKLGADRDRRNEDEEKILMFLAETGGFHPGHRLIQRLGLNPTKGEYYLGELSKANLIQTPMMGVMGTPMSYAIAHPGRGYLIKHDLIK